MYQILGLVMGNLFQFIACMCRHKSGTNERGRGGKEELPDPEIASTDLASQPINRYSCRIANAKAIERFKKSFDDYFNQVDSE